MTATARRNSATLSAAEASQPRVRRLNRVLFDSLTEKLGATTVDERAALVDVHRATLYRWYGGPFTGGLSQADQIAAKLRVPFDELFPVVEDAAA
ncbi:MAG TPA: hypothetical protein VHA75_09895 [Rugosimonospora sp.]|nr:hypothetical protein [Rugosimonospora sp.]